MIYRILINGKVRLETTDHVLAYELASAELMRSVNSPDTPTRSITLQNVNLKDQHVPHA